MKTRIITAAVGLGVLAVVLAFFDTFLFDLVLSAVCLIAIHEVFSAMGFGKKQWYLYAAADAAGHAEHIADGARPAAARGLFDCAVLQRLSDRPRQNTGFR